MPNFFCYCTYQIPRIFLYFSRTFKPPPVPPMPTRPIKLKKSTSEPKKVTNKMYGINSEATVYTHMFENNEIKVGFFVIFAHLGSKQQMAMLKEAHQEVLQFVQEAAFY